jgi:phosphate transport system substrate-binding protein
VEPTPKNIANGSYPYFRTFFMVTGPNPSAFVQKFIDFVFSKDGRNMLSQTGHWISKDASGP